MSPPGMRGPQVQPTPVPATAVKSVQATPVAAQAKPVAKSMMQAEASSGAESELACPACGTLGLITRRQMAGITPVICGSDQCSAHFFIRDEDLRACKPN